MNFSDLADWVQSLLNAAFAASIVYYGGRIKNLNHSVEMNRRVLNDLAYRQGRLEMRSE